MDTEQDRLCQDVVCKFGEFICVEERVTRAVLGFTKHPF